MIYTSLKSKSAHRAGTQHTGKSHSRQAVEYDDDAGPTHLSVYSAHCVVVLNYSHGTCYGCGFDRDLVNKYCEVCRACGENEAQCINYNYTNRSEQGKRNSQKSMWRTRRVKR